MASRRSRSRVRPRKPSPWVPGISRHSKRAPRPQPMACRRHLSRNGSTASGCPADTDMPARNPSSSAPNGRRAAGGRARQPAGVPEQQSLADPARRAGRTTQGAKTSSWRTARTAAAIRPPGSRSTIQAMVDVLDHVRRRSPASATTSTLLLAPPQPFLDRSGDGQRRAQHPGFRPPQRMRSFDEQVTDHIDQATVPHARRTEDRHDREDHRERFGYSQHRCDAVR